MVKDVVDTALCLMNWETLETSTELDLVRRDDRKPNKAKGLAEPFFVDLSKPKEHVQNDIHSAVDLNVSPLEHQSENYSEVLGSEVLEGRWWRTLTIHLN